MGTTPSGDTRASTGTSVEVIGITPSSSICCEYDSATANPIRAIVMHFVGSIQPKIYWLEGRNAYQARAASNSVTLQGPGNFLERYRSNCGRGDINC